MNTDKINSAIGKFLKGVIAGGLAQVSVALSAGTSVSSLTDVQNLSQIILTAFVTGAALAAYKMFTWKSI